MPRRPARSRPTPPDLNRLAQQLPYAELAARLAAHYQRQGDAAGYAWATT